ncbi:hypothetical protein MKW98_030536, partial [Papaver atlanticum]
MDQYPEEFCNVCDYSSLKAINTIIKEDKFIHVRHMIREKTPFGELLKMDQKNCIKKHVALNAVKTWDGEKLVIGEKGYEIDEELVKKCLSLSITGNMIIEPSTSNHVPTFIKQAIPSQMLTNRKQFNLHVVAIFRSKDDVKVIDETDEVVKLSKLYTAFLFSALLFPKYQRIPFEYFYLLNDRRFCNLKSYRFDIEVAKFLRDGIMKAKNAKTRSATVSGCLHIVECLFSQEKLSMSHIQNTRERKENEVELDDSATALDAPLLSFKRPRLYIRNCSEGYFLKKETQSENPKSDIINIQDDSSEEGVNDDDEEVTDDEMQFDE